MHVAVVGWLSLVPKEILKEKSGSKTLISSHSPDQESHHKNIISPFPSLPAVAMALAAETAWAWQAICSLWDMLWDGHTAGLASQGLPSLCNATLHLNYFLGAWAEKFMSGMGYGISGIPGWASCVLQHWHTFVWKGSLSHQAAVIQYFWSPPVSKSKQSSFQGQLGISADLYPALQAVEQATSLVI